MWMMSTIRRPALCFAPSLRPFSLFRQPPTFSFPNPVPFSRGRRLLVSSSSLPAGPPAGEGEDASASSPLLSSVSTAPAQPILLVQWNISRHHFFFLNALLSLTAISTTWLFFSAIPALLAFKRACESLEKLLDVTREEIPDTMAAVRLSGMEISDLTMELSDLGEEITQGVRNSTRVVRVAHDKLRHLTNMTSSALSQGKASRKAEIRGPVIARKVRILREGIVQGRGVLQVIITVAAFSKWASNCLPFNKQKASKS